MKAKVIFPLIVSVLAITGLAGLANRALASPLPASPMTKAGHLLADDPNPPASPVKLIFIHHSTGGNWLADPNGEQYYGGLGRALMDNNYFVSATNYGWGPDQIGLNTDLGYWWDWFRGDQSITYTAALYAENGQNICNPTADPPYECFGTWPRLPITPTGENEIIMFKGCFPNAHLSGNPDDPPTSGDNPLRGQSAWIWDDGLGREVPNPNHTVANAKGIYNDILQYFATRQDKLFIVVTGPPLLSDDAYLSTDAAHAANYRAFNDWLVNDWLASNTYTYTNVAVFDYYNVLTSNGGTPETNDAGQENGNHHRWWNGALQHVSPVDYDFSAYGVSGDSHPNTPGQQKATAEFVQVLNVFYNRWKGGSAPPPAPSLQLIAPNGGERWPVGSQQIIRWTSTGTIVSVSLAYSTDGFGTSHVIESSTANTGLYTWTTPVTPAASMRIRVASTLSPTTVYDDSDADFSLYDPTGQQVVVFQNGVAPAAGYTGTVDAFIDSREFVTVNVGSLENLEVFYYEGGEIRRSLLRWDLSALPPDVTVNAASLELYRYGGDAADPMGVTLHRVTREWTEGTGYELYLPAGYVADGTTWLSATTSLAWTSPGGDYDPAVVGQATLPGGMGMAWVRLDATSAVCAWVEQGQPNYGLLLRSPSGPDGYHYFHSSEQVTPTLRPRLVVTYTTSPAVSPALTLTTPNGGERWPVNSQQTIRWTSSGSVPSVSLSYSTDGFSTSHLIASSIANTGQYSWTAPFTPAASARVRVASTLSPTTVYDDSDAGFALLAAPVVVTRSVLAAGTWYNFGAMGARIRFSDTGSVGVVTVTFVYTYPTAGAGGLPRLYAINADGHNFTASLALGYSDDDVLAVGVDEGDLQLYRYSGQGAWTAFSSTVDIHNNLVTTTQPITTFSVWTIGGTTTHQPTIVTVHTLDMVGGHLGWIGLAALVAALGVCAWRGWRRTQSGP